MRILAIIVTYYPEKELLQRCASSFLPYVDHLLVWENTPAAEAPDYRFLQESDKVEYAGEGENSGISRALNFAWRRAAAEGYDYLLTMDQDSYWQDFASYAANITAEGSPKGIYGPRYNREPFPEVFHPTKNLITSGMMVPVDILDALGGYCEAFKVDAVDTELICHAMTEGYNLYYVSGGRLVHRIGNKQIKTFLGKKFTVPGYSPERLYYIYRNHRIVIRMYPKCTYLRTRFMRDWGFKIPVRIMLGERPKRKKLRAIVTGSLAGRFASLPKKSI